MIVQMMQRIGVQLSKFFHWTVKFDVLAEIKFWWTNAIAQKELNLLKQRNFKILFANIFICCVQKSIILGFIVQFDSNQNTIEKTINFNLMLQMNSNKQKYALKFNKDDRLPKKWKR